MKIGETMSIGATVVAWDETSGIVLAIFDGKYVTWCADDKRNPYWGRYFNEVHFQEAVSDYITRVEDNTPRA